MGNGNWTRWGVPVVLAFAMISTGAATPPPETAAAKKEAERLNQLPPVPVTQAKPPIDHSGRPEKGRASYYAKKFTNRKMANGRRFDPNTDVAASKTLPLGTTAKVVNTENGKEATVRVEDRGPFVSGRVVDLAPKVAKELDLEKAGTAPVVVKPIAVPQPDGAVKLGAGAAESSPQEVRRATEATRSLTDAKEASNNQ